MSIKSFENPDTLIKMGDNLVMPDEQTVEGMFTGEIQQGYLEMSNVNTVSEMVNPVEEQPAPLIKMDFLNDRISKSETETVSSDNRRTPHLTALLQRASFHAFAKHFPADKQAKCTKQRTTGIQA